MNRSWLFCAFCLCAVLLTVQFVSANSALRVNPAKTRASLHNFNEKATIDLAIENVSSKSIKAHIKLELVDTNNVVRDMAESDQTLATGLHTVPFDLQLKVAAASSLWYRLRYEVKTADQTLTGIIALSEITPDLFEIRTSAPVFTPGNDTYRATVTALHPFTLQPLSNVNITGTITLDADEKLKASGVTNKEGNAVLEFQMPENLGTDTYLEFSITGEYKGLKQEADGSIQVLQLKQFFVSSDKLLYQPGQTLHIRGLLCNTQRRAFAGQDVTLKITDEENQVVYRASLKTSQFGIASADWNIPANIRLGNYDIRFDLPDGQENWGSSHRVRISRYELPNFTVQTKTDRPYYLLNQSAQVEVRGEYLFGQPVTRGHVKIVHETERRWNFREQKWDIEEAEKQEGELDKTGRFIANLNLSKDKKELQENEYRHFDDLSFTAYITDATTNRTEQRRFDVRLTKEPIHVYLIDSRPQSQALAPEFYISTYYADGSPASCKVTINSSVKSKDDAQTLGKLLRTVKTNRYGLAKVEDMSIKSPGKDYYDFKLKLIATDSKGLSGTEDGQLYFPDRGGVRVKTDKPLYRAGEPIAVRITADQEIQTLFFNIYREKDWKLLTSRQVRLVNGRATVQVPYQKDFTGQLDISAHTSMGRDRNRYDYPGDSRKIIYPQNDELKLAVTMNQPIYRPGQEASADISVKARNSGIPGVLGIAIFDKAVDERARTDSERKNIYSYYDRYFRQFYNWEQIAGMNSRTLNQLDLSKPLPEGMQLVAEVLLRGGGTIWQLISSELSRKEPEEVFKSMIVRQLSPLFAALNTRYQKNGDYPTNETQLRQELSEFGFDFDAMLDPFGTPYRPRFSIERDHQKLDVISAGLDRKFDTDDDFVADSTKWNYFQSTGEAVYKALFNHHDRTGKYINNLQTLETELRQEGIELSTLRDHWGKAYQVEFGVAGRTYFISFISGGADRSFKNHADNFTVWTASVDYTVEIKTTITDALNDYYLNTKTFPQNDTEFAAALKQQNVDKDFLRDGWGKPLYAIYKSDTQYRDMFRVSRYTREQLKNRTQITSVTQERRTLTLRSIGADGKEGTWDDFDIETFSRILTEEATKSEKSSLADSVLRQLPVLSDNNSSIIGIVTDPNDAVITSTKITAKHTASQTTYPAITNEAGWYILANVPSGLYDISFEAPGFKSSIFVNVSVTANDITEVNVSLEIGGSSQTVMVTASAVPVQTRKVQQAEDRNKSNLPKSRQEFTSNQAIATPRLRQYFPETLFWQPEIITDANGRTQVKFKLADNITTWKFSMIASTLDGRIGFGEHEIRTFQPFFAELDPPPVLTTGDRVALPVVLRNYMDKPQTINLQFHSQPWFEMLGAAHVQSKIAAGDVRRETFDIRATSAVKEGKQRVDAIGSEASDAIEKTVNVHPDGQQINQTASQIFADTGKLEINIPAEAIKNSTTAELKIYPNIMAHVFESIEAIMQRPYGCAEQTISSAYPSLLALRYCKQTGDDASPVCIKARRYLQTGYEKLLNYQNERGGFSYWGRDEADFALTAYALKFLTGAGEFIAVDQKVIDKASDWLIKHQENDGRWIARDWHKSEDKRRSTLLTAYIAQVSAALVKNRTPETQQDTDSKQKLTLATKRALAYLDPRVDEIDEPYLMATYALAAYDTGEQTQAEPAIERLRLLSHDENGGSYWSLETNTPFYGWGLAGRVETTALVLRALTVAAGRESANNQQHSEQINRGLLFLMRQKDRYGIWYSTQATVNVLDTLSAILLKGDSVPGQPDNQKPTGNHAEIIINGKPADSLTLPPVSQLINPLVIDISKYLSTGKNSIEIRRSGEITRATAQIVETHYENWSTTTEQEKADALRFAVNFDKTQAAIGEEIICKVTAERVGFRGYGMILAEIGLPPGADVDRASLDTVVEKSDWSINQYDVLPDRVVVYLWPRAGGLKFDFKFRQRFAIEAKNASSVLYDYYNPEASAVLAPVKFFVK